MPRLLLLCAFLFLLLTDSALVRADDAPPTPKWLHDITRVAYTDLPNTQRLQDWPEKVITDFADAGVQLLFSRAHSGESWRGLGWKSRFGELDSALRGEPVDWEIVGGALSNEDAHGGDRCLRLIHGPGRTQTYLNRRWVPDNGRQGAMLDRLQGELSYWYKVRSAKNARLWLGAIPMSAEPRERSGAKRSGIEIPPEQIGDGQWHHVVIPFDYTGQPKVKWVQVSCFIYGDAAELLLDDIALHGTDVPPLTNGGFEELSPDRDGTREVTELCHQHGMRYIPYYWAQREPVALGQEHPEWRCLSSAGKPTAYYCINTGYRDLVRQRIVELVKDVGVDGIFFDMFHTRHGECYCDACRQKFHALTGQEPPTKEDFDNPLWQQWVNFKYRSIESAMLDFNRGIKQANPEAALVVNTWNAWIYENPHNSRNSIRVIENVDGLLEETGWYDIADPSFFAAPARHNFMNWHLAGLCRDKRAMMWGAPHLSGWGPVGETEVRIRVATMMTNGAVPAHSATGRDTLRSYMKDIAEREPYFRDSRLAPWCGLVVSEKSELWYGRDKIKNRYVKGVYGAFQAMLERHLPVSLVTDRQLELGDIEQHKVLVLPNCAAMSDAELETVRRFVENGGGLVATYATSAYDEQGRPRETFGLGDVFHAKQVGEFDNERLRGGWHSQHAHNAYLRLADSHPWGNDPVIMNTLTRRSVTQPDSSVTRQLPLHCRMLLVEPTVGKSSPLRLTTVHANAKSTEVTRGDHPAVIESTYGKGKVIYLPFDLTWSFYRYGHEYLGRMLELAIRSAAVEPPPVEVEAPTVVQAMTHTQGDRLVVHLLNDASSTGRSQNVAGESLYMRREVLPIHNIQVTFRDPTYRRFLLVPGETPLSAVKSAEGSTVTVPKLDIHCMIVAEP